MSRVEKTISAGCLILVLIHFAASYFPGERLWGLNLLYFLPGVWRWMLVISALLVLVPGINKTVSDFFVGFFRLLTNRFKKTSRYVKYTALSLVGGAFFWIFRVKTFLLGDAFLRARQINLGGKLSFTEPLDFLFHVRVSKLLQWDAFQTYAVLSVLAGMAFIFLILLLQHKMAQNDEEKALIFSVIILMGANQLFFGYVESYTLVYVVIAAYALFSFGYLMNRNGLVPPVLLFLLAFGLHLLSVTLLPSLLYLILAERAKKSGKEREMGKLGKALLSGGMVVLVGVVLFLLQSHNPDKKGLGYYLISPLGRGEDYYSVFSFSHILDLINHQLLVSPVGILILLASFSFIAQRVNLKDKVVRFLLILSLCSLAYAFFIDPKLGYPRDWDLFAFSGLGYTFLAVYVLLKRWRERAGGSLRYVTVCLLFSSLISTFPWIYVNATEKPAVARFEHLLDLDNPRSAYGRENLAMYYNQQGNWQKEIEQWKKAIALTNGARYVTNLAVVYYNQKQFDLALAELEKAVKIDSTFDFSHFCIAEILVQKGEYQGAIEEYRKAIKGRPSVTQYYDNLGALLANLKRYPEAIQVLEEGLKASPGYPSIYRNLGYAYYNSGDSSQAEKYLKLYLQYSPQAEDEAEVRGVLASLLQNRLPKSGQ
ncbi:MAG: tetratricopeptide repeat protein [Candidatus Zixiibacteriota bacterium]